jgi:outer membrane protein insertion porin family
VLDVAAGVRPPIVRTDVRGSSPLSTERILELTGTAPGQPFRRSDVEAKLVVVEDTLRQQGYYSAVALLPNDPVMSDAEGGLVVPLLVNAGPRVTLQWDGPKPPGDEELFVPMRRQRSVDEDLLEDSDQRVAAYWRRQGYHDARVSHTRVVEGDRLVVTMHVDRGRQHQIRDLRLTGNVHMNNETLLDTLGVRPGMPYDQSQVASGIARLRAAYQRLGYYRVSIQELDPEDVEVSPTLIGVNVRIDVAEGPQARVASLELNGIRPEFQPAIRRLIGTSVGAPYVRDVLVADREAIEVFYRNRGFENIEVAMPEPAPSGDDTRLAVVVNVNEGPQIIVEDIRVIGNRSVSEASVKEQIALREGEPFGEEARRESARRLYQMGVFRQVSIEEEPRVSGDTVAHVVITVEELPATSIGYGGGLEAGRQALKTADETFEDRVFVAPRGFFEIGRRNLWGKNRSIDFFSRIAPRPATSTTQNFGFLEYRVSTTYREPRAFHSDTDLTVGVFSEQAARTGFNFARKSGSVQVLRRLSSRVSVTGRYGLEQTRLFDVDPAISSIEIGTIERLFAPVRLSLFSGGVVWDRRDDLIDPAHGTLSSIEGEASARRLGSQAGFVKVFFQTSAYQAMTADRRTILAGRMEVGLARGFERMEDGLLVDTLPISQRFFAGGSTTVRGFQLDRLGVPDRVVDGVLRPGVLTQDGLSVGGNGVVVLNGEVRTRLGRVLGREFGVTLFSDAGNVFPRAGDIAFGQLRATVGFGLRYNSPLGPVRLDFGFKTDRQVISGRRERGWEYHLNIGEAF